MSSKIVFEAHSVRDTDDLRSFVKEAQSAIEKIESAWKEACQLVLDRSSTDAFGNQIAQEGCDRCSCGNKYWAFDNCKSCGKPHPNAHVG